MTFRKYSKDIVKFVFCIFALPVILIWSFLKFKFICRPTVTILLLHDLSESQAKKLYKLILILRCFGDFITPQQFARIVDGQRQLKRPAFLITFDDGFVSSGSFALKYLSVLNIKSVFFICPGFVGAEAEQVDRFVVQNLYLNDYSNQKATAYQSAMNQQQITQLIDQGHQIGSHTKSHLKLSLCNELSLLNQEIAGSKQSLEKMFSISIEWFAYPFGDLASISPMALEVIGQNYKINFTGIRGVFSPNADHAQAIWRDCITLSESLIFCLFVALGGLRFLYHGRQKTYLSYLKLKK